MNKEFTNDDLKAGMFVELKNGYKGVLIPCYIFGNSDSTPLVVVYHNDRLCNVELYSNISDDWAIIRVYDLSRTNAVDFFSNEHRDLLWEYEEPVKEMTVAEIEEALGYKVKIVRQEIRNED